MRKTLEGMLAEYANWRIYFLNNLSKLPKSALLVIKPTIGTRP